MIISVIAILAVVFIFVALLSGILCLVEDMVNLFKGNNHVSDNEFIIFRIFNSNKSAKF